MIHKPLGRSQNPVKQFKSYPTKDQTKVTPYRYPPISSCESFHDSINFNINIKLMESHSYCDARTLNLTKIWIAVVVVLYSYDMLEKHAVHNRNKQWNNNLWHGIDNKDLRGKPGLYQEKNTAKDLSIILSSETFRCYRISQCIHIQAQLT